MTTMIAKLARVAPTETFYYGALAAGAIFAVLLAWTLMRPAGKGRRVAAAITGVSFLILFVPMLVALWR